MSKTLIPAEPDPVLFIAISRKHRTWFYFLYSAARNAMKRRRGFALRIGWFYIGRGSLLRGSPDNIGFQNLDWVSEPGLGFRTWIGFQNLDWVSEPGLGFRTWIGFPLT